MAILLSDATFWGRSPFNKQRRLKKKYKLKNLIALWMDINCMIFFNLHW